METETLDKLYLEWSQFTEARTAREIRFEAALLEIARTSDAAECQEIAKKAVSKWRQKLDR